MTYGMHDALRDTIVDLRGYGDLTALLKDETAITEGWPADPQTYPVELKVQPVTDNSQHSHNATRRTFRIQFSVVAELEWRESQQSPTYRMAEIMAAVADRLDVAADVPNMLPEGTESGSWQEVSGDRVALIQDWRITRLETR